ncbi:MAG: glycosyltransferase family 2 protein [Chloroflexi bacterium]|nr:glycosyltransferase family 2 protein [Chloroflexota bacterium]
MAQVDIIIPNWNGREWLGSCLESLQRQTFRDLQIILVDNGSTDGSAEFVRVQFPEVKLVELSENRGFTGGINAGIRAGSAEYLCWFNNDAEAAPDFLEQLLNALKTRESEGFGMAAARVLFQATPDRLNSAGIFVGPDGLGRDRGFQRPNGSPFDQTAELFGPAGVAALYRRAIFDEVGLLDEDFFLYSEEIDLNYRAQLAGYRCLYVPTAGVVHRGSATARRVSTMAARLASRNGLLVIIKNLPGPLCLWLLPWIVVGQVYQLVLFARQGKFIPALQGKLEVFKLLRPTLSKRRFIQQRRKVTVTHFRQQMALGRTTPRLLQRFSNCSLR